MRFYYAETDAYDVLCVEKVHVSSQSETEVRKLADEFTDSIYFEVEEPPAPIDVLREAVRAFGESDPTQPVEMMRCYKRVEAAFNALPGATPISADEEGW